jgi:hypothetical protein
MRAGSCPRRVVDGGANTYQNGGLPITLFKMDLIEIRGDGSLGCAALTA